VSWRYHGRAKVSPSSPSAFGVCDRCGIWHSLRDLTWQFEWAGTRLQNLRLLVCDRCLDVPQPQLKARIIPPDPVPVFNARPENFSVDENTFLVTNDGLNLVTNDGLQLVTS
jgi:hypothetical protein